MSFDVQAVQKDLKAARLDGWLFYDFRGRDPIAHRILRLPPGMRTRRWFYFVPVKAGPRKLVHKIEPESLATLPGETLYYAAHRHAISPEARHPLCVDSGCRHGGAGAQRRSESIQLRGPGAKVRSMLDSGTIGVAPGRGRKCGSHCSRGVPTGGQRRARRQAADRIRFEAMDFEGI